MREFAPIREALARARVERPGIDTLEKLLASSSGATTDLTAINAAITALQAALAALTAALAALDAEVDALDTTVAADHGGKLVIEASENLQPDDLVNVWNDAGAAKVRLADGAVYDKEADGYVKVACLAGDDAEVHFKGNVTGTFTPGKQYLSFTTPGGITDTPPDGATDAGCTSQVIGIATTTKMKFTPRSGIQL